MAKVIGLTGGIGSGKTTVAKQFEALGVPIYIADVEAKKIMELPETIQFIKSEFGNTIFDGDKLNREKLAKVVFNNPEKLQKLNSIIHPLVNEHFKQWLSKHSKKLFVIKETAILFESGSYKYCDKIISVVAPLTVRIQRVMERDGSGYEAVMERIQNQWTDEMRIEKSDFVIENTNLEATRNQVNMIFKVLEDMQN